MFKGNKIKRPLVLDDLCMLCGVCEAVCPKGAISVFPNSVDISFQKCNGCGKCKMSCPAEAME